MDVNQSLGRVKRSDLVQSGRNTSQVLWERCSEPISDKSRSYHLGTSPKTRFRAHLGLRRAFLDVNQSLGRVERSDLVQSGQNTSPGVVVRCSEPISNKHGNITWGRPQKHDFGLIWASGAFQRPLEAKPDRQEYKLKLHRANWSSLDACSGTWG